MGKCKGGPLKLRKIQWPPKPPREIQDPDGLHTLYPGEPVFVELQRFVNDRALTGSTELSCCDCGLRHFIAYSVFRGPEKQFYLVVRNYRDDGGTDVIDKKKRKRLKKKYR